MDDPLGEFVHGWLKWEVSAIQLRARHVFMVLWFRITSVMRCKKFCRFMRFDAQLVCLSKGNLFGNIVFDAAPDASFLPGEMRSFVFVAEMARTVTVHAPFWLLTL